MKKFKIKTVSKTLLADIITPVSVYLRIRDVYPNSLLLESSDYRGSENSYSFICLQPVAGFETDNGIIKETYPDESIVETKVTDTRIFNSRFDKFIQSFEQSASENNVPANGLFGYIAYDAIKYFETIKINEKRNFDYKIPDIRYHLYKYIIAINHFQNTLQIIENQTKNDKSDIEKIESLLKNRNFAIYSFRTAGEEQQNISDAVFRDMVSKGREHCQKGNVFQVVMSRQFSRQFSGDEFNVYRALRSVNPSPYLFYFDYTNYKLFGSSPEAHLKIKKGKAFINPIAGTFRRTGDDENDKILAQKLALDAKENSEHVMLVDLARNDLSRHSLNVKVDNFREVQFYSHVIHLVSSVSGEIKQGASVSDIITSTFPAGTLTGAPKYMAMNIISRYESQSRGYYGGAIGFLDFKGNFNHAIMIRTFLSKAGTLFYQAGAGIVSASDEENELQEVNNKLGALRQAIEIAQQIN